MIRTINIQFHMLEDELADFVAHIAGSLKLQVELETFHPKSMRALDDHTLGPKHLAKRLSKSDRVWLVFNPSRSSKPERFMLNIGRRRGRLLEQSQLGAGARSEKAHLILRKVATELRRRTNAGCWVVTEAGNVRFSKAFRLSEGAICASRSKAIELTNLVGTQQFLADKPDG